MRVFRRTTKSPARGRAFRIPVRPRLTSSSMPLKRSLNRLRRPPRSISWPCAAGPGGVGLGVDVELQRVARGAVGRARLVLGAVGHHHRDGVVVGVDVFLHGGCLEIKRAPRRPGLSLNVGGGHTETTAVGNRNRPVAAFGPAAYIPRALTTDTRSEREPRRPATTPSSRAENPRVPTGFGRCAG